MRRGHLRLVVAAGVALALAGCAAPSPEPTSTSPTASEPTPTRSTPGVDLPVVDISVDADGTLDMPTELASGAHRFHVSAAAVADVVVLRPREGYTKEDLASDFGPHASQEEQAAAAARFEEGVRSFGGTWSSPEDTFAFAQSLESGEYWFVDLGRDPGEAGDDDTLDAGSILTVTVTESADPAPMPEADAVASANEDRSWTLPETIPARGSLMISNESEMSHRLVLERVPDGEDPEEWLEQRRVGHRECPCGSPGSVSADTSFAWIYDLQPGHYVVVDRSVGELGYPQYNGAGASLVELV